MNHSRDVYTRFAPFIREYIYREKWAELRGIQERAAAEIFDRRDHLLIAAETAAGKTEAVFFPVLTVLDEFSRGAEHAEASMEHVETPAGTGEPPRPLALYVSPLKALINDQAERLERILRAGNDSGDSARLAIRRWHGDVPGHHKEHFLEDPSGVLLITPESLESLLLRRGRELWRIFSGLLFVIIDEVHAFMGSDRGSQLLCQLARIETARRDMPGAGTVRRIGLSATLGDYNGARRWLSLGTGLSTTLLAPFSSGEGPADKEAADKNQGRKIRIALDCAIHGCAIHGAMHGDTTYGGAKQGGARRDGGTFYRAVYDQCRGKRMIVFANSRLEAEECAASLGALARSLGEPDIFSVHHGSLSALLRNEAEKALKSSCGPRAVCATATLELGIDIGDMDRIIQLGPPWSVSAFVQRLGRSGRRTGKAEMFFCLAAESPDQAGSHSAMKDDPSGIAWDLLRTMAVIQLYLEERWIEPPEEKPFPYSLLLHQTLAVLASLGEQRQEELVRRLLSLPPFGLVPPEDFYSLLLWLEDCDLVERTEEGTYLLGLEGERIVCRHDFYPVFPGDESFRVMLEGREIGTIHFVPDPGSVLAVGGKRWEVKHIDGRRREIWVGETTDWGGERLWRGRGGVVSPRIVQTIHRILCETSDGPGAPRKPYPYLSPAAGAALETSRRIARNLGITKEILVEEFSTGDKETASDKQDDENTLKERTVLLFPWTGSAGMRTIAAVLGNSENKKKCGIIYLEEKAGIYFRIRTKLTIPEFRAALAETCREAAFDETLIKQKEIPYTDKYDYLLPPRLLAKKYAAMFDPAALEMLTLSLSGSSAFSPPGE